MYRHPQIFGPAAKKGQKEKDDDVNVFTPPSSTNNPITFKNKLQDITFEELISVLKKKMTSIQDELLCDHQKVESLSSQLEFAKENLSNRKKLFEGYVQRLNFLAGDKDNVNDSDQI